jgi:hypothetical protein
MPKSCDIFERTVLAVHAVIFKTAARDADPADMARAAMIILHRSFCFEDFGQFFLELLMCARSELGEFQVVQRELGIVAQVAR